MKLLRFECLTVDAWFIARTADRASHYLYMHHSVHTITFPSMQSPSREPIVVALGVRQKEARGMVGGISSCVTPQPVNFPLAELPFGAIDILSLLLCSFGPRGEK